jgi:hypothetical protein
MTVWEKTLVNLQKGYAKLTFFAATFSDRVRAEINIVRLKMQINDVRNKVGEQQRFIGQKLLELRDAENLPRTLELFFKLDEISSAVEKIERYQKDQEILLDDLQQEAEALKPAPVKQEEGSS